MQGILPPSLIFLSETLKKSYGYTGRGVATYPNGDIYEGSFENGVILRLLTLQLRHGEDGVYKYNNKNASEEAQDLYRGAWFNNLKSGIGKMTYVGIGTYYGYWENNERNGEGVMTYSN